MGLVDWKRMVNRFMIAETGYSIKAEVYVRILTYLLLLLVILIGITFALLNPNTVTVHYYIGQKTLPLSLLLAFVFALGCLLGLIVGGYLLLRVKLKNYNLKQCLKVAEKEIQNLRAIPLQDRH